MLRAATPSIIATVSSTDGGAHSTSFRARNSTRARYVTRLFPSGSGWFRAKRTQSTAALSNRSGRTRRRRSPSTARSAPTRQARRPASQRSLRPERPALPRRSAGSRRGRGTRPSVSERAARGSRDRFGPRSVSAFRALPQERPPLLLACGRRASRRRCRGAFGQCPQRSRAPPRSWRSYFQLPRVRGSRARAR
jgi:hypothetical protein